MTFLSRLLLFTVTITLAAGCVSTQKRFERAIDLEERGQYADAASYYIQVLRKEPDREEARQGLERVGAIAIDNHYDEARTLEAQGAFERAMGSLDAMRSLYESARDVRVQLNMPPDYDQYRANLSTAAIRALIQSGQRAEDAGDWEEALKIYENVEKRYDLPIQQQEEVLLAKARVHVRWGEQEMSREYYRVAYDHGTAVVSMLGPNHPRAQQGIDLQQEALRLGTRDIAFLPLYPSEQAEETAPAGIVSALNDMLIFDFWEEPPMFLHLSDPVELRRELRRLRYDTQVVSRSEAAEIGRALESDMVVVGEIVRLQYEESRVKERAKEASTRGPAPIDTTYIEKSFTYRLVAEVSYSIIDTDSRRELTSGTVTADVTKGMTRGVYAGDYRDLDLSRSERQLFDEEELTQTERDMEDDLLDKLAPRIADRIFEGLLKQIK
ncbi:MAG: LPS assembly lipoprotein LptE [Rhodothermales bacterium]